ncbi:MAG: hypothetical protein ACYC20_06740 [Sulfurovum sp.]
MEGYAYESMILRFQNDRIDSDNLFTLGMFSLAQAYINSGTYRRIDVNFFYFEFLLNMHLLDASRLEKYIQKLYKTENLEKTQSTYTLIKYDKSRVALKEINRLIVVNPFTEGLKILMLAMKDKRYCSKEKFEEAIEKLSHIKYYHVEAILIYSQYLKEIGDDKYNHWLEKGYELAIKHHYRYLLHLPTPVHSDTQPFFIRTVCQ